MSKGRLEAFTDGVMAILITIMVLELHTPEGMDLDSLRPLVPVFLTYLLSFIYLGIYGTTTTICSSSSIGSTGRSCGRTCTCCSGCR